MEFPFLFTLDAKFRGEKKKLFVDVRLAHVIRQSSVIDCT